MRHLDKVGVLARVLELLSEAGLNVEHMQNRIFTGGEAAVATIDVAGTVPARPACAPRSDPRGAGELACRPRLHRQGPRVIRASAPLAGATRTRPTTARSADVVRPFAGWLVRAEAAAEEVDAMSEVAVAARSAPRSVRPDAYEPMPPALYVYRQSTPHGEHIGIVCDVTPEAFLDGRVRGHESVQPDRVDALARYLATVPQRVELVSTLHRAGPVVRATLARAPELPPAREVAGPDGSRHTVWRIPGARRPRRCAGSSAPPPTTSPTGTTGWRPA